jgi:hypothetical protein
MDATPTTLRADVIAGLTTAAIGIVQHVPDTSFATLALGVTLLALIARPWTEAAASSPPSCAL